MYFQWLVNKSFLLTLLLSFLMWSIIKCLLKVKLLYITFVIFLFYHIFLFERRAFFSSLWDLLYCTITIELTLWNIKTLIWKNNMLLFGDSRGDTNMLLFGDSIRIWWKLALLGGKNASYVIFICKIPLPSNLYITHTKGCIN